MLSNTRFYINVSQVLGITAFTYLAVRFLKLEEHKAGMQHKSVVDVIKEDVGKASEWVSSRRYRMYRHV